MYKGTNKINKFMAKEAKKEAKTERSGAEALGVYTKLGKLIRVYTESETDERATFVEKAEEFAKKVGGEVRKEK